MKLDMIFFMIFFIVTTVGFGLFIYDYVNIEDEIFTKEVGNHLMNTSIIKRSLIEDSIDEMESDLLNITKSNDVKNLLTQEFLINKNASIFDAEYMAKLIASGIERYMLVNPDLTINDLRNSPEFYRLAIEVIGKNGYSSIIDHDNKSILIGNSNDIDKVDIKVAFDYENNSYISGFYGENFEKYVYFLPVKTKTFDDAELIVQVVAYSNDYLTAKDNNIDLEKSYNSKDYRNLLLISPEGQIVYMSNKRGGYGTNLNWDTGLNKDLYTSYIRSNKTNHSIFYGPFDGYYGDLFHRITLTSKVYENDKLIGFALLMGNMRKFDLTLKSDVKFGESEILFLINNEKTLITPFKKFRTDLLSQQIKTENTEKCIKNLEQGEELTNIGDFEPFLDYDGNLIYGVGAPIMKTDWCLLTEIDKEEIFRMSKDRDFQKDLVFVFKIVLLLILIGIFMKIYFLEKSVDMDKNNFFIFLGKNKLKTCLFLTVLFTLIYSLLIALFFNNLNNINFIIIALDLFFILILSLILSYSSSSKDDEFRKLIFIGSLFFIIGRLIKIPTYGYSLEPISIFNMINSTFGPIIFLFGSLYFIFGFGRLLK